MAGGERTVSAVDWDRIVADWGTREGLSEHARRAVALEADGRREPGEPVPGCPCPACATYAHGGDHEDADVCAWLVDRLARECRPEDRRERAASAVEAWAEVGCVLPSPSVLCELAERVPGALPPRGEERDRDPLPVEEARSVPIRDVAARLGLGEPTGRWGEPRVLCPLHDDHEPSLRLREVDGLWYCDPCAQGGDGIQLAMEALGMDFAEAVRWIVEGGAAPTRDPRQRRLEAGRPA